MAGAGQEKRRLILGRWAYNRDMPAFNLTAINPADLAPIPDVPDSYGPRNDEDRRVLALVQEGLASGKPVPLDDDFFAEIDAIISQH